MDMYVMNAIAYMAMALAVVTMPVWCTCIGLLGCTDARMNEGRAKDNWRGGEHDI
jgi:hypothetical protein